MKLTFFFFLILSLHFLSKACKKPTITVLVLLLHYSFSNNLFSYWFKTVTNHMYTTTNSRIRSAFTSLGFWKIHIFIQLSTYWYYKVQCQWSDTLGYQKYHWPCLMFSLKAHLCSGREKKSLKLHNHHHQQIHVLTWRYFVFNRWLPEITGKGNLTVFSYSGRVKSPEWRWQRRRADLQHFEIFSKDLL